MLLAIGDVVRVTTSTTSHALGTVAGFTRQHGHSVVHVNAGSTGLIAVAPDDLQLVARGHEPRTPGREVTTLLFLVLGIATAVVTGLRVQDLGGSSHLTLFVTCASAMSVPSVLTAIFHRPRRVRV